MDTSSVGKSRSAPSRQMAVRAVLWSHSLVVALLIIPAAFASASSQEIKSTDSPWTLRHATLVSCDTCTPTLELRANNSQSGGGIRFVVPRLGSATSIKLYGSKAIVTGFDSRESQIMVVHDLDTNKTLDSIQGLDFLPSPSGRYIAFQNFYSWHDPRFQISDVILLYDASQTPDHSRGMKYRQRIDEYSAGKPIFPRSNMEAQDPEPLKGHDTAVIKRAWSPSGNTLGFIAEAVSPEARMQREHRTNVVIFGAVDLRNGIDHPVVYVKKVPIEDLLKPKYTGDSIIFSVDDLSISDEGTLEYQAKSVWRLKSDVTLHLFKDYDERY